MERDFVRMGKADKWPYMSGRMDTMVGLRRGVAHLRKMREVRGMLDGWLEAGGILTDVKEGICVIARFMLCAMLYLGCLPLLREEWSAAYMNRRYQKMAENMAVFYVRTHTTKVSSVFGRAIRQLIFERGYLNQMVSSPTRGEMPLRFRRDLVLAERGAADVKIQAALEFSRLLPLILYRIKMCRWGDRSVESWIAYYTREEEATVMAHLEILGY
jgi:hypothetical protein